MSRIQHHLNNLYENNEDLYQFISAKLKLFQEQRVLNEKPIFDENTNILITYPGQFHNSKDSSLSLLKEFLNVDLKGLMTHVHILPFHPWSSDDGFSCINYEDVDEQFGSWEDLKRIPQGLMVDCVFNHISAESPLFRKALSGDPEAKAMFHFFSEEEFKSPQLQEHLKMVVRPRTSPLCTEFEIAGQKNYAWTTFSADQVDLNMANPKVMGYLLETMFNYIESGARLLRVDAVPFFWKELGTNCSHHPKTHEVVKLFRAVVSELPFEVMIVTESNVPHHENITYWGEGTDEAHLIYNFSLAPLILHGLTFETSRHLVEWASLVFNNSEKTSFINFTSTHDGIGMRGLEGLVSDSDIAEMCQIAKIKGGHVGMKTGRDGLQRPYELNITWASFLNDEQLHEKDYLKKVVHSHALPMFFPGLNTQYVHNFFGSQNWFEGVQESSIPRRINRKTLAYPLDKESFNNAVLESLLKWTAFKNQHKEFSPQASIKMRNHNSRVLSFERSIEGCKKTVHFNLTSESISIAADSGSLTLTPYDLIVE